MIGFIYKITSPSGKIYIGQSTNLQRRFNKYRSLSCENQPRLYNSLKKYGWESHVKEILFEGPCSNKHLNLLEIEYIKIYKSNYKRYPIEEGLNLTDGGEGNRGPKSEEFKLRMRGRKQSPETLKKRSATRKGYITSNETRAKISASLKGRTSPTKGLRASDETRAKLSAAKKGIKKSPESIAKRTATRLENRLKKGDSLL